MSLRTYTKPVAVVLAITLSLQLGSAFFGGSQSPQRLRQKPWIKSQKIFSFDMTKGSGTILPIESFDLLIPYTNGPQGSFPEGQVRINQDGLRSQAATFEYFFGYATGKCSNLNQALKKIESSEGGSQPFALFKGTELNLVDGFDSTVGDQPIRWKAPKGFDGTLVLKRVKTEKVNEYQLKMTSEYTFISLSADPKNRKERLSKVSVLQTIEYDPKLDGFGSGTILPIEKAKGPG